MATKVNGAAAKVLPLFVWSLSFVLVGASVSALWEFPKLEQAISKMMKEQVAKVTEEVAEDVRKFQEEMKSSRR